MKIDNQNTKAIFGFTPAKYFLVHDKKSDEWSLNPRIDRSEKGKDDDIGSPKIFLLENEVEICKKAGFSWIETWNLLPKNKKKKSSFGKKW